LVQVYSFNKEIQNVMLGCRFLVKKIDYFLLPDDLIAARINKILLHEGFLVLCDFHFNYQITILDKDLNKISVINNYGEGPGEYMSISDVVINDFKKSIDVLSLNRIIRFDFKGNFVEEFKTPYIFNKIEFFEKDKYLV
jgi:hypothetical protein